MFLLLLARTKTQVQLDDKSQKHKKAAKITPTNAEMQGLDLLDLSLNQFGVERAVVFFSFIFVIVVVFLP